MTTPPTRARFSPAPTGYLHVGSARSALFNWIFARSTGGLFLVRIEDTDVDRSKPELTNAIFDSLAWLGVEPDEEPVRQSDRFDLYRDAAQKLTDSGQAYACDCTQEEVQARAKAAGGAGYDGHCRDRGLTAEPGKVVRFRTPDEGTVSWIDTIRGEVSFACADLEDFVVVRSSGVPMFLVANAVDDSEMEITHVIRGEDLVNTTPKVILLRRALGYEHEPEYAHLPLIVNDQRKKLSKRRDDVNVADYRDRGFLAEAMTNYLATLGWGPPDEVEIRPITEIIELFKLADVNKAPAAFDIKKLTHFNDTYIRELSAEEFVARATPFLDSAPPWPAERFSAEVFAEVAPMAQGRVKTMDNITEQVAWAFEAEPREDEKSWTKAFEKFEPAPQVLASAITRLDAVDDAVWTTETLYAEGDALAEEFADAKKRDVFGVVRVGVFGTQVGPPLWEALTTVGRAETLRRLNQASTRLG